MEGILPELGVRDKKRIKEQSRQCQDAALKTRYLIIVNLMDGQTVAQTASALQVGRSTVYKVAQRFREHGDAALVDRREENGRRKMDDDYLTQRHEIVAGSAQDYGWRRPTWTREMLTATMTQLTRVRIHVSTMSRALKQIGARLGRPKPVVGCPWPECRKNRRLQAIQEIVDQLPKDGVAVYEDEVNIHLNPKIGPDWMMRGQQKEVLTPGRNGKRYLAGAVDWRTNELIWVEGQKKNTLLFIQLLWKPVQHDSNAKVIHVIPDNFSIHSTKQVEISLTTEHGLRLRLHFQPPYCPDHNRIERVWKDLHADVTRNHRCSDINQLMHEITLWLRNRNKNVQIQLAA
jgi:transposase